jgi:large subunit ribosomal protein L15
MMIHEITIHAGKYKARKRIGRGEGSGHGKTAGRGHKGAASRSGWKRRPGYEGGQMPIFRRMPKRGFTNAPFRRLFHVVNVKQLDARFDDGATVTRESLAEAGLIRDTMLPLKVLGEGTLSKKLNVTAARFSATAKTKIEEAGGTVTVDVKKKWTRAGAAFAKAALDAGKAAEAAEIAKGKKTKKKKKKKTKDATPDA